MKPMGALTEHYWLVQRMAKAVGCDTAQAMEEGRLDPQEWAEMVTRCRGCEVTCACRDWLARAELEEAPGPRPSAVARTPWSLPGFDDTRTEQDWTGRSGQDPKETQDGFFQQA